MKKILFFILLAYSVNCFSQIIPKEQYLVSKMSVGGSMGNRSLYATYKKSSLYFNDKIAVIYLEGFNKSPLLFTIISKKYNIDGDLILSCYRKGIDKVLPDSTELSRIVPTLQITVDYNTKVNLKNSISVNCLFRQGGMTVDLTDAKSLAIEPSVRNRYVNM